MHGWAVGSPAESLHGSVPVGRQRGCGLPTLGRDLYFWAVPMSYRSRTYLHVGNQECCKSTFSLCSSQAMLQFDLKSISSPSVSVISMISDMVVSLLALPSSPSLQQVSQHVCVKKACAGLFCSWPRYKQRMHFLGSVWNDSRVSYCSSVIFLNVVTWYVWVVQNAFVVQAEPAFLWKPGTFRGSSGNDSPPIYPLRAELTRIIVPALPSLGMLGGERWDFIPLLCLLSWGGAHCPCIPGSLLPRPSWRHHKHKRLWLSITV